MPGILYHLTFAEKVFKLMGNTNLNKQDFFSGNLIPDLALDKKNSHYRIDASVKGFVVPDLEKVRKDLLKKDNSLMLGMFCHLYLDYYFIEHFLIPSFNWDFEHMEVINPRNNLTWPSKVFFAKPNAGGILYKGYTEINQLLVSNKDIKLDAINIIPEILPKTGIEVFDTRREKTWKAELDEYLAENIAYTGDILNYNDLTNFINSLAKKFVTEEICIVQQQLPTMNAFTFAMLLYLLNN